MRIVGLGRTQLETVLELLPRTPPAHYTDAELTELKRRLANLGIFDSIVMIRDGAVLEVRVREKWR